MKPLASLEKQAEKKPETHDDIVDFVMGHSAEQEELRTAHNYHGSEYERYDDLLANDDRLDKIKQLTENITHQLEGDRGRNVAFQLASIRMCLDVSQAIINKARYSEISEEDMTIAMDVLGNTVRAVPTTTGLVDLIKKEVEPAIDAHQIVTTVLADYEESVLGRLILPTDSVYHEYTPSQFYDVDPREISHTHPSLVGKGVVGFRDMGMHPALLASVDTSKIPPRDKGGLAAFFDSNTPQVLAEISRHSIAVRDTVPLKDFIGDENHDELELFREIHTPHVRQSIEDQLGVRLEDVSLDKQFDFLRFASTCTVEEFERASTALLNIPETQRAAVFDAFMSTRFGTDYSESILSIAEKYPAEQAVEIFETIGQFNDNARAIALWYKSYDPELAQSIELAMRERLSDALVALDELGAKGRLDIDVSPGRHSEGYVSDGRFEMHLQSPDEGLEIVKSLGKSLELIRQVTTAEDVQVHQVNKDDSQFIMYRFSSEQLGDALLYIRPEAAKGYDQQLEYGNRAGVEASISFIVNPTDPHHLDAYKDPQGVSIRFDREGRLVDESPFSEDRDPTRQDGSISVDISSLMGDGRHMPVKIGRFVAAGNLLRAVRTGSYESLHHNNNYFNQARYGTREGFAKMAVYTAHMAAAMIEFQKTGSHASPYPSILAARR